MKDQASPLLLNQQLCFALYRASRAIIRTYTPLLKPLGITYLQYLVMLVLWESDGIPVKEIGEKLALDSATLTPLLKKLEHLHLVSRQRSQGDERVVQIFLSEAGKKLKTKANSIPATIACRGGFHINSKTDVAKIVRLRTELHEVADRYL